jgi:hypothetical protein
MSRSLLPSKGNIQILDKHKLNEGVADPSGFRDAVIWKCLHVYHTFFT